METRVKDEPVRYDAFISAETGKFARAEEAIRNAGGSIVEKRPRDEPPTITFRANKEVLEAVRHGHDGCIQAFQEA